MTVRRKTSTKAQSKWVLRPGVINPAYWFPKRPKQTVWRRLRKTVLERDNWTCVFCGHRARKWMNLHHVRSSRSNSPKNLVPVCVACHAVLHIGYNLSLGVIEIWQSKLSQVEIVRRTREGVRQGRTLSSIKRSLRLKRGSLPPKSIDWANQLVLGMGRKSRASLEEPYCAVFVMLKRWQIEEDCLFPEVLPNKALQPTPPSAVPSARKRRSPRRG